MKGFQVKEGLDPTDVTEPSKNGIQGGNFRDRRWSVRSGWWWHRAVTASGEACHNQLGPSARVLAGKPPPRCHVYCAYKWQEHCAILKGSQNRAYISLPFVQNKYEGFFLIIEILLFPSVFILQLTACVNMILERL